jgi:hypothetical protein
MNPTSTKPLPADVVRWAADRLYDVSYWATDRLHDAGYWAADRLHSIGYWPADRLHDLAGLNTDQQIAFTGVIITALSAALAALAAKYARDAVREGRGALVVAQDSMLEQRAVRRVDQLQSLFGPLRGLTRAAATAEGDPDGGAPALHEARAILKALLRPLAAELPLCRKAIEDDLDPGAVLRAVDSALTQLTDAFNTQVAVLDNLRNAH